MELSVMTWVEVEKYLTSRQDIIIPIGSTEQHGPMGLIGTDAMTATAIGKQVAAQTGAILAPTISVGMALHHLAFPGSISLRPSTLIAYLQDYVISLARNGFTHFFFVNGHGGNIATTEAAFAEIYDASAKDPRVKQPVTCKLVNWFNLKEVQTLATELYGDHEGYHATPSEVSVTWALYPDVLKDVDFPVPDPIKHPTITTPEAFKCDYPTGVMGANPRLACQAHGEQFIELAKQTISAIYQEFIKH